MLYPIQTRMNPTVHLNNIAKLELFLESQTLPQKVMHGNRVTETYQASFEKLNIKSKPLPLYIH